MEEFLTVSKLPNKKGTSPDNIQVELIRCVPLLFLMRFVDLINMCRESDHMPEEWRLATVIPIFKNGNSRNCNNYPDNSLLGTCYETFAKVLEPRINI
jgi:hypothetical protein